MNRIKFSIMVPGLIAAIFLSIGLANSAVASSSRPDINYVSGTLPDYYPSGFQRLGVLNEIRSQYLWIVNGVKTTVSNNVEVHSLVTNYSSLYSITQGMELGYSKNDIGEITEIWELSNGTIRRN